MPSALVAVVEAISALATLALVYLTLKPCKASKVSYLLGIPAGFGLLTLAFVTNAMTSITGSNLPGVGILLGVVYLLTQTYGLLFLSLTYARRTRFRFIGESTSIELAIPSVITFAVLAYVLSSGANESLYAVPGNMEFSLRSVMALSALYLTYETERNWSLTRKAGEGVVTVGFALLFIEQLGFILSGQNFGDVALFLGYEGRILGLFVLIAVTHVGIKKDDVTTVLKRLGLRAPAHY
jgi:hypothetical protein